MTAGDADGVMRHVEALDARRSRASRARCWWTPLRSRSWPPSCVTSRRWRGISIPSRGCRGLLEACTSTGLQERSSIFTPARRSSISAAASTRPSSASTTPHCAGSISICRGRDRAAPAPDPGGRTARRYYFQEDEVRALLSDLPGAFPSAEMVFDACSPLGRRIANRKVIEASGMECKRSPPMGAQPRQRDRGVGPAHRRHRFLPDVSPNATQPEPRRMGGNASFRPAQHHVHGAPSSRLRRRARVISLKGVDVFRPSRGNR